MINVSPEKQKKMLIVLLSVLAALIAYRLSTSDTPASAPLTYTRGAVAASPVRTGLSSPAPADPLQLLLSKREEKYPGVIRDIFRMQNPASPRPKPAIVAAPTPTLPAPPPVPVKTPEEVAADAARADLSKFRFLGYLTDKDSSLFLSKDGELFIARSGDTVLKNYRIKEAGKDYVVLFDTATKVERKVELSGSGEQAPHQKPRL